MAPGNSGEQGASFHRVSGDSVRSAGPGWRRSSYVIAGAPGWWIPAQRALSIDPAILLQRGVERLIVGPRGQLLI